MKKVIKYVVRYGCVRKVVSDISWTGVVLYKKLLSQKCTNFACKEGYRRSKGSIIITQHISCDTFHNTNHNTHTICHHRCQPRRWLGRSEQPGVCPFAAPTKSHIKKEHANSAKNKIRWAWKTKSEKCISLRFAAKVTLTELACMYPMQLKKRKFLKALSVHESFLRPCNTNI